MPVLKVVNNIDSEGKINRITYEYRAFCTVALWCIFRQSYYNPRCCSNKDKKEDKNPK
jgi:hypothetical protein